MTQPADTLSEELRRVPGLFRRWELPDLFEPHRQYLIEEAGAHADGTPLYAVYMATCATLPGGANSPPDSPAREQDAVVDDRAGAEHGQ